MASRVTILTVAAALALVFASQVRAEDEKAGAEKKALTPVQTFVGEWKGQGMPKGGSAAKDAWTDESEWAWEFKGGHAAIVFKSPANKFYSGGRLVAGEKEGTYALTMTLPDGKTEEKFTGTVTKTGDLEAKNESAAAGRPERITFELVAKGKRMLTTYFAKGQPLAEVGATRKGSGFGKDAQGPECVVTGGVGTSTVSYKGQTYYVCCGGCREEFNENPEKILAEFKERKEKEKAEAKK